MHILIVEHDLERRRRIEQALAGSGHHLEVAASAGAALASLSRPAPPDLLAVDAGLSDMGALDLLQAAAGIGAVPPVVLFGDDERAADWIESARLGAVDYVFADEDGAWLGTLAGRLRATRERDAEAEHLRRMADALASTSAAVILSDRAGSVEMVNDACSGLLRLEEADTSIGSLDDLLVEREGVAAKQEILAAVQSGGEWVGEADVAARGRPPVPCLVTVSPIRRAGGRLDGMVLTLRDVSDRVTVEDALRAANLKLAEQAARDPLTGLYNRSYLYDVLDRELARATRYGGVLSVLMLDLDQFKAVNDEYGHPAGDAVLRAVAQCLRPELRDGDVLARYGGDEFCAILPSTPMAAAHAVADRLRRAVAAHASAEGQDVRVSIGIATSEQLDEGHEKPANALLAMADEALYTSKDAGGNRVTRWKTAG